MSEILKVEKLSVVADDGLEILHDISFSLREGEFLAVIGPNGGGKSTLLRALMDLIPFSGTISWQKTTKGYMPAQDTIDRSFSPFMVLDLFALKSIRRKTAEKYIESVGLPVTILDKQLRYLSTGEFQRVFLAWILALPYKVILLDEPIGGMDIAAEKRIYSLLSQLKPVTVIMVTHHIHMARQYADKLLFINKEQLFFGPANSISFDDIVKQYERVILYGH